MGVLYPADKPVNDPGHMAFMANLVSCLDDPFPAREIGRLFSGGNYNPPRIIDVFPSTALMPDWAFIHCDSCMFIVQAGIRSAQDHFRPLLRAYLDGPVRTDHGMINSRIREASITLSRSDVVRNNTPGPHLYLGGHSFGGAILLGAMPIFKEYGQRDKVTGVSFGSPKVGGADFVTRVFGNEFVRVMAFQDPVPLVPPNSSQAPQTHFLLPFSDSRGVNEYVHTVAGLNLDGNGRLSPADFPTEPEQNPQTSLYSWCYALMQPDETVHSISVYVRLLSAYLLAAQIPNERPEIVAPNVPDQVITPQENDANIRQASDEARLNLAVRRSEIVQGQNPPRLVLRKEGPFWMVNSGEVTLYTGPDKRSAKAFRSRAYSLWRYSHGVGVVDGDALHDYLGSGATV